MDVVMPQMGESIAEGTIVKWLKKPGDAVEKDEPLFEISTDKVDAEIPSPGSGTLQEILVPEGNTVEVNTVVARIAAAGAEKSAAGPAPAPATAKPAAETKPTPTPAAEPTRPEPAKPSVPSPTAPKAPPAPAPKSPPSPPPSPTPGVRGAREPVGASGVATLEDRVRTKSSPLVRKMAAEHDADITQMHGTGIHGRVTKQDFERHLEAIEAAASAAPAESAPPQAAPAARPAPPRTAPAPAPARTYAPMAGDRVEPMSVMRLKIAEHMIESRRTSAHVQTFWEIDVSHLDRLRREHGDQFLQRNGVKLTYTAFIAKATCDALKAIPIMNSSLSGTEIVYHGAINLGIAVALDWGLIVPVIKNAGDMNISGLARSITDLAGRARSKRLSPDEVTGGTFTITNPGVYGGLFGCPIINQPQVGILGVGAVEKRPVVIDDAIAIRPMNYLSLSFDHRVIDGATAEQFMGELKKSLLAINESAL
jgi:2-oxoglutarate dehydrogenase E2 component (dihydrolipoamide succinyltransferase)